MRRVIYWLVLSMVAFCYYPVAEKGTSRFFENGDFYSGFVFRIIFCLVFGILCGLMVRDRQREQNRFSGVVVNVIFLVANVLFTVLTWCRRLQVNQFQLIIVGMLLVCIIQILCRKNRDMEDKS